MLMMTYLCRVAIQAPLLPLPVSHADVELLLWDLTLREVQAPLARASFQLAKVVWPGNQDWGSQLLLEWPSWGKAGK